MRRDASEIRSVRSAAATVSVIVRRLEARIRLSSREIHLRTILQRVRDSDAIVVATTAHAIVVKASKRADTRVAVEPTDDTMATATVRRGIRRGIKKDDRRGAKRDVRKVVRNTRSPSKSRIAYAQH